MAASSTLIILCLLATVQGDELYERMIPSIQARMEEIRWSLLPLPEEEIEAALFQVGNYVIPLQAESEVCRNHSRLLLESFLNKDLWALKMVDAGSKIPSGMIDGHLADLGSFDQCLSVEAPGDQFQGQHCVVETKDVFPDLESINSEKKFVGSIHIGLVFSVCVPSSCSPHDVKTHFDIIFRSINASAILSKYSCSTSSPDPFSFSDWLVILLLAAIVVLIVLSTAYDNLSKESEKSEMLRAFSLSVNIPHMVDTHSPDAAIPCLNGLRVLTMFWIIIGHRAIQTFVFPSVRIKGLHEIISAPSAAPLISGQLSVEVFFLLTGLLVSYSFLRYRLKSKHFNILHFYLVRYLRLTLPHAMMILLYSTLLIRATDGPLWKHYFGYAREFCVKHWWSNLLYIQNYVYHDERCIEQSWYLASDFQLYLFSPILLIPLHKRPRLGLLLTGFFFLLTTAGGLYNAYTEGLQGGGAVTVDRRTDKNLVKEFVQTHIRAGSFLLGIAMGYLLFKIKQGQVCIKLSRVQLWAGWLLSLCLLSDFLLWIPEFEALLLCNQYTFDNGSYIKI